MTRITDSLNDERILLAFGTLVFVCLALLGWNKLQFGFNFMDEGMYMTDGWRLATGDRLFPDSSINVTWMYSFFNKLVFQINPDITLLGFRKLQFCLTLLSLLAISFAIWRRRRQYWFLPLVLSLFAFTGLDANGMCSNLSYYTYPHLFLTLHIACIILGMCAERVARNVWMIASGFFLWCIGFSLLPLSMTAVWPIIFWLLTRKHAAPSSCFSIRDLLLVLSPVVLLWAGTLAVFSGDFIPAALRILEYVQDGDSMPVDYSALAHFGVAGLFLALIYAVTQAANHLRIVLLYLLSIALFFCIKTNLNGMIPLYWNGWFSAPMWFCALLTAAVIAGLTWTLIVNSTPGKTRVDFALLLILYLPAACCGTLFTLFSSLGILTLSYVAIPVLLGLTLTLQEWMNPQRERHRFMCAIALVALYLPFYYHLIWADWRFTYFDLPPSKLTHTITEGFGAGIKTNVAYYKLTKWMGEKAKQYSSEDDLAIMIDQTAMGYMLTKRRPAINHSWTGFGGSSKLRSDAIAQMKAVGKYPTLAFRFLQVPFFFPISLPDETFQLAGRKRFTDSDPLSGYIVNNMVLTENFRLNGQTWVELFVADRAR